MRRLMRREKGLRPLSNYEPCAFRQYPFRSSIAIASRKDCSTGHLHIIGLAAYGKAAWLITGKTQVRYLSGPPSLP